jgi:DHA1 family bicyclomycin/chloramphenicol resistance-like MFS transporter
MLLKSQFPSQLMINTDRKALLTTLILGVLTAISSISIDIYLPAFNVMADYFNVPIVRMESSVTVFLFGMAFGQLFIGPLSDIWGRKIPLRVGLLLYVICSIGCMLTGSFLVFLGLRFLQGLAGSACQVISRALVSDLYADNSSARIFTILQIIMGISPIVAPIIGSSLAETSTWKLLFLIMAVVSAIGLLGCLTILPAGKAALKDRTINLRAIGSSYAYAIKSPAFLNYALVRAISNSAAFSFVTASPFVLTQLYKIDKQTFGYLFSFTAVGIIVAGMANTMLLKRFEVRRIIKFSILIQMASGVLALGNLIAGGPLYLLLAPLFIFLSMLGLVLPNATAMYLSAVVAASGSGSALVGAMSYLSAFLITGLLSLLHNNTAYPMLLMMLSCACVAYCCLQWKTSSSADIN